MKDILWLIKNTLNNTFRSKRNVLIYFGLPLIGIFISTLVYGSGSDATLHLGIVNKDGSQAITEDTIHFVESLSHVKISVVDPKELNGQIASSKLDSALIFDQGFAQSVREGSPQHLQIVSIKGAQVTSYVKSLLYSYLDNVAAIGKAANSDDDMFAKIYAGYQQSDFKLSAETIEDDSANKNMTNYTVGFLVMFMLFGAISLSGLIIKEKESRTYYRLLTSPITAKTYVIANVIVNLVVMLIQIGVTLFMMKLVFHIDAGIPFWQMFIILFLFALVAIGISLAIVAFTKSSASAGALQSLLVSPTCLISGCFFPISIMPESIRKISEFLPQHWLLDTFNKLQQGNSFGDVYLNMLILLAFAMTFSLLAIYKFGRNNDTRTFV